MLAQVKELKKQSQDVIDKVYLTECIALGIASVICKEKWWFYEVVYWLSIVEQNNHPEQVLPWIDNLINQLLGEHLLKMI